MRLSCSSGSTPANRAALAALYSDAQLVVVYQFLPKAGTQDVCASRYLLPSALKSDKVEMATHSIAKLDEIQSQLGAYKLWKRMPCCTGESS